MTDIHPADRAFGSSEEYDTSEPREALVSPKHFPAILLSTFLGGYGIDRMYIGRVGLGIAKLAITIFTFIITLNILRSALIVLAIEIEPGDTIELSYLYRNIAGYYVAIFCLSLPSLIWAIVDSILICSGRALDGNGNPLIAYAAKGEIVTPIGAYQPQHKTVLSPPWYSPSAKRKQILPRQAMISPQHQTAVLLSRIPITSLLGIDRMYMGRVGMGTAKLVTFGGLVVWAAVDSIIIAKGNARDGDGKPLISYHSTDRLSAS